MHQRSSPLHLIATLLLAASLAAPTLADAWPNKHRDMHNTGRADFVVPPSRQDSSLFDILRWQTPTPNGGGISSSAIVFFDGAGPGGADLAVTGYHWPKGVIGVNRHTGATLWQGNPAGGESIGALAPAFSPDGSTVYVINDATPGPLMALPADTGPSTWWSNAAEPDAHRTSNGSPLVTPDGRIWAFSWSDRPAAALDTGSQLRQDWYAQTNVGSAFSGPSFYDDNGTLRVTAGGRFGAVRNWDGDDPTGFENWSVATPFIEARVTIDPANGNVYVGAGTGDVYVVGISRTGNPLPGWGGDTEKLLYTYSSDDDRQGARSAGCLSHDGATYYFQTVANDYTGTLYAVNTADGSLKWTYVTGAGPNNQGYKSSPIVTPNGVIIVGTNGGGEYLALRDDGAQPTLLDSFTADPSHGIAHATPTLSADGLLYIPAKLTYLAPNGNGDIPSYQSENLLNAFDLNDDATAILPPPAGQIVLSRHRGIQLEWLPIIDPNGQFQHYAIYRDREPFDVVTDMTPIATIDDVNDTTYFDPVSFLRADYYYVVTTVSSGGGEVDIVAAIGPRRTRSELDLQVASVARWPQYPRYLPTYEVFTVTEPSGFGPYTFSAATGLAGGQTADTQRWPETGDTITYEATVRNRGTLPWDGQLTGEWTIDGVTTATSQTVTLAPDESITFEITDTWTGEDYDITYALTVSDGRSDNNSVTITPWSVPCLTYIDRSFAEEFLAITRDYPQATTDDILDWLQHHAARMNAMFAEKGSRKRIHYNILEVIRDSDPDPAIDRTPYAIFPFRYFAGQGHPRLTGYYRPAEDIDYGLLHEMGHQLGLIDLYRMDVPASANLVSNQTKSAPDGLMRVVSTFFNDNSIHAMNHWFDQAHGYYGQYLYSMPETIKLRVVDARGTPLAGAAVKMYQKCERPGLGEVITTEVKAQGVTGPDGTWELPNVPIDNTLVPTTFAGDTLNDNPFGYVAVVGTNGTLLFEIEYAGNTEYAWMYVLEANDAYFEGQTTEATFDRALSVTVFATGDMNCDGAVDFFDIDPFVVALLARPTYETAFPNCSHNLADLNGDGVVDFFDIDPFVGALTGGGN